MNSRSLQNRNCLDRTKHWAHRSRSVHCRGNALVGGVKAAAVRNRPPPASDPRVAPLRYVRFNTPPEHHLAYSSIAVVKLNGSVISDKTARRVAYRWAFLCLLAFLH